jgi:hypothetical protein
LALVVRLVVLELLQGLERVVIRFLVAIPQTVEAAALDFLLPQAQQSIHLKLVVQVVEVLVEVILEPLVTHQVQVRLKEIVVVTERTLEM